jgi:prepilin-type N-terminal cleavage/methylation domain-containing protein
LIARAQSATLGAMASWRTARGSSLPELLVGLAVLGLVMSGALGILHASLRAYRWGEARIEAQQAARIALERMQKELREAGYDPTAAGIAAVVAAEPARVVFQRDLDGDGVVDPTSERVAYLVRPGESVLRRDAGAGAQPVINGVRRFRLTYVDRAGHATVDPAAVVSIRIEVHVGPARPPVVMQTLVSLRNASG